MRLALMRLALIRRDREGRHRRSARNGDPGTPCRRGPGFVADLARGLADRGHDVHLYAASGPRSRAWR